MMRILTVLSAAAVVAVAAAPALAQGMMPGRMFGPRPALAAPSGAPVLPVDQAIVRTRQYLNQFQNPDLVPVEIIEFSNVFYVVIQEKSTGKGAFGLLVDRVNGNVSPEMGPPMMWNTKYGRWTGGASTMGPGMMGPGMMGPGFGPGAGPGMPGRGMMGPGYGPGYGPGAQPVPGAQPSPGLRPAPGAPAPRPQVAALDEAKAKAALQTWVSQAFPGAGIGKVVEFPGFFTYRLTRDGKTFALASVHAYGGQVWYAWQYGTFVREQVIR
jgi:hypothetical protein